MLAGDMPVEAWGTSDFLPAQSSHWIKGADVPISVRKGCGAQISTESFLIVSNNNVREFDTSVMEDPTSETGWQPEETWPQLLKGGGQQPGCATIGSLFVVAGGNDNGNSPRMEIINLKTRTLLRLQRWCVTIPSSDQWQTTIGNHRIQWLPDTKTIEKPLN